MKAVINWILTPLGEIGFWVICALINGYQYNSRRDGFDLFLVVLSLMMIVLLWGKSQIKKN